MPKPPPGAAGSGPTGPDQPSWSNSPLSTMPVNPQTTTPLTVKAGLSKVAPGPVDGGHHPVVRVQQVPDRDTEHLGRFAVVHHPDR